MEREIVEAWLEVNGYGYGYGKGYGDAYGYGKGYGKGYGDGKGDGYGYGKGYSYGYGDGYGKGYGYDYNDGIVALNGEFVYIVDRVPTIIKSIRGGYAQAEVVNNDMTTTECYVAKVGNKFAHGHTLREAREMAQKKYNDALPVKEKIAAFVERYPTLDTVVPNADLFREHNFLTRSCEFGRRHFVEQHGIDLDGSMTVAEFITRTSREYGGDIINRLLNEYKSKLS